MVYKIINKKISELKPIEDNANVHPEEQLVGLEKSINAFGLLPTILILQDGTVVSGNGTLEAYKRKHTEDSIIPVVDLGDLPMEKARAIAIAINQLAKKSFIDPEKLRLNLQFLENKIDLDSLGFGEDLKLYLESSAQDPEDREQENKKEFAGVNRILLHYESAEYLEFSDSVRFLAQNDGYSSVSETVLAAVRYFYDNKDRKQSPNSAE